MATGYWKIKKGLNLEPLATAVSVKGDLGYNSATDKLELYNGAADPLVNETKAATLTNKTMSGSSNTFSAIAYGSLTLTNSILNADINASAAIDYSKLSLANSIINADINASAGIVDTKLATISTALKVSNSATTATSANTNSAIVARDGSGNFSAGTITGTLTGTASGNTTYTPTNHGVVVSSTTNAMTVIATGSSGDALISGGSGSDPAYGTLGATHSGTAQTSWTAGDLLYASATNTLAKLGIGTANQGLSVVNGLPAWATTNQGGINYIAANPNAEVGTTGWATYADAAGTTPVNGTGGSPTETWTRSTSSPLRGTGSFLLTKDAANRQGEGASYDFTLDSADQAKPICVSFDYAVASGTYADGDLTVYLYDITNSLVIQPAPYTILNAATGLSQKWIGYFQTSAASTSYRLIVHTASTSASAYTVKFDNVNVGPTYQPYGAVVTDWSTYTPTGAWTGVTYTGKWRRVGDSMELNVAIAMSGAPTGTLSSISLPSGYTIDTTKINQTDRGQTVGYGLIHDTSASRTYVAQARYSSTTLFEPRVGVADETYEYNGAITATIPTTFASGDSLTFAVLVPITGWSSNVQVSSDADTRVCAASYRLITGNATGTLATGVAEVLDFNSKILDTHNAVTTGASWKFTAPMSGIYEVSVLSSLTAATSSAVNNAYLVALRKNGGANLDLATARYQTTSSTRMSVSGTAQVQLSAGDFIDLTGFQNAAATIAVTDDDSWIHIKRISGPAQIAASEKVHMLYTANAGTAFTANVTDIPFTTKVRDSHNAWSGSVFTAPRADFYCFTGNYQATASLTAGVIAYVNGSQRLYMTDDDSRNVFPFSGAYYLNAGDTLSVRSDVSGTLVNSILAYFAVWSQG